MRALLPLLVKHLIAPLISVRRALVFAPVRGEHAERILVVRLDAIGDVVLTVPMLRAIRAARPLARITVVVTSQTHNILETCSYVDEILVFDASKKGLLGRVRRIMRAVAFGLGELLPYQFDVAIVPRWDVDDFDAAVLAFSSGAARRIGFSESVNPHKAIANRNMDQLYTDVVDDTDVTAEAERPLKLLALLGISAQAGALEVVVTDADRAVAEEALRALPSSFPLVAIATGAADPRRRWPKDRFIDVARMLVQELGCDIVVLGGPGEEGVGEEISEHVGSRARSVAGKLSLRETAAVLESCDLLVTNDSGPLHLGAAMGVPVVEISCHPKDGDPALEHSPVRFGPWCVAHVILQPASGLAPCREACVSPEAHCITRIGSRDVLQACVGLLGGRADDTGGAAGAGVPRAGVGPAGPVRRNGVRGVIKSTDEPSARFDRGAGQGVG